MLTGQQINETIADCCFKKTDAADNEQFFAKRKK